MKKFMLLLLVLSLPAVATAERVRARRGQGLNAVCSSVTPIGSKLLYKAEISHHIPGADARASGPTLVCGSACPSFPASVFYSDGDLAHKLGYYGVWSRSHGGNGKPRAYCAAGGVPACSVRSINQRARQGRGENRRNGKLYLKMTKAKRGPCLEINDPDGRNGSV